MMYPLLHETLNVGSLVLKNRLVLPPMATEKSAKGQVTDGLVAYYGDMARSGPGLIIQEHSFVSPEGRASANQVSLAADADIPGLQRLTAAVHAQGVPILAQISHAGSAAHRAITGQEVISASAVSNPSRAASVQGQPEFPREMTQGDIQRIVQAFVDAAVWAQQAGYDGVEIHSAHGYLLDQFYSPVTNKRTDDYTGQTLAGRTRLHVEIIQAIRRQVGSDFVLSLRLGGSDYMDGGAVVGDVSEAAKIFETAGIDMLSLSGHKFHGPKGAGALYTRRGIALQNVLYGGGQERGHRAGTENVPAIAGLAAALAQADANLPANTARCLDLRQRLTERLLAIPGNHLNGDAAQRLPGNVNITFDGVEAETLLLLLDEAKICASAGSACSAGAVEPSHVLLALGLTPAQAKSTLRLTLDAANTAEEIDTAAAVITACVQRLRDGVR